MALYPIRSERQFCERLNYDLLFKWFFGLAIDDRAFDASTLTKNRDRLLDHDIADRCFAAAVEQAPLGRYLSSDHFSTDGTVLEAWASHKCFKPKDRDPNEPSLPGRDAEQDFHRQKRSNTTHESTTDPEARLYRRSAEAPAKMALSGASADGTPQRADGNGARSPHPRRHGIGQRNRPPRPNPQTRPNQAFSSPR